MHELYCHFLDLNPGVPQYHKDIGSLGGDIMKKIKPFKPVLNPVPPWGPGLCPDAEGPPVPPPWCRGSQDSDFQLYR